MSEADLSTSPQTTVNAQIVDAVRTSTEFALGFAPLGPQTTDPTKALSAGAAIAYDKAVQAAALSVQDATDYQRNVLSISAAVQGKALAMILGGDTQQGPIEAFALAIVSSLIAPITAGMASTAITKSVSSFPKA